MGLIIGKTKVIDNEKNILDLIANNEKKPIHMKK
jgi:hypothetical protein